jgi:Trk-type K+ transport system membrane component
MCFGTHGQFASLTGFVGNLNVNLVCMAMIVIGGLGFIVWYDHAQLAPRPKAECCTPRLCLP